MTYLRKPEEAQRTPFDSNRTNLDAALSNVDADSLTHGDCLETKLNRESKQVKCSEAPRNVAAVLAIC